MTVTVPSETAAAHDDLVALITAIPDAALDWRPGPEDWSAKQIIGHLSMASGFFAMIVEAARAADFGHVAIDRAALGPRMAAHESAFAQCATTRAVRDYFEDAYLRSLDVIGAIPEEELDRPFVFTPLRPGGEPSTVTLRERVVAGMGRHLRDHEAQLRDTLDRWRGA